MPRLRHMNPEKFRFSEQQLQKLRGTHRRLRRLNRTVLMHLRQLRPHFSDQQYRDAGRLLGLEASRINSLLQLCQQIIESDSRQPEAIILTVSFVCPTCVRNEPPEVSESQPANLPEALEADPAWQAEIDWALELVCRTEERGFARCLSRGTLPGGFFSALNRLRKALLQQKSHLLRTTPEQPMPLVELRHGTTCTCGDESAEPDENQDPIECREILKVANALGA
ncbi:MAG: hypothetical protein DMG96_00755 [Acidobacteria bacterium]|nr:MAG: hypothetical protein DMG96_00755 [Acidobacteriota bacterium]